MIGLLELEVPFHNIIQMYPAYLDAKLALFIYVIMLYVEIHKHVLINFYLRL